MFVRTKSSPNSPRKTVQIVESVRNGKSVSQKIVQYIGVAQDAESLQKLQLLARQVIVELEEQRKAASSQPELFELEHVYEKAVDDSVTVKVRNLQNESTVVEGPMEAVERMFSYLGYDRVFGNSTREAGHRTLLKQLIAGMLARPSSKLGLSEWFASACATDVSEDRMYRFLDALHKKEDRIKQVVRQNTEDLLLARPTLMLFDVTTLHNESQIEDNLRKFGFSKANKANETQTVLALATTPDGMPLWYELFPGNTYEGDTLRKFIDTWRREEYPESKGVIVADSAMSAAAGLTDIGSLNLNYVVGARLKNMSKALKEKILTPSLYTDLSAEDDTLRYQVIRRAKDNIVVVYSANRARHDAKKRERLLVALKKKLGKSGEIKSSSVQSKKGRARYLKSTTDENETIYVLDEEKIAQDAQWDGIYGMVTDLPVEKIGDIREILSHYRSLWRIEESFRISKSGLKIRPIFHSKEERIRAHISLVYMAYACIRHLQMRLKLTQNVAMSVDVIREALLSVTSSLIRDKSTGVLYRFPKVLSTNAARIYRSLGIRHSTSPTQITSMAKYRARSRYLRGEGVPES